MARGRSRRFSLLGALVVALAMVGGLPSSPPAAAQTESDAVVYRVNSADGDLDGACQDLTTVGGTVVADCTLADAIFDANLTPEFDLIHFDLPAGPHTILLDGPLPAVTDPVEIDATTQDGYQSSPLINLAPSGDGGFTALWIQTTGALVSGLAFNGFATPTGDGAAITISGGGGNRIESSWFGFDHTGTPSRNDRDILIDANSTGNVIGGHAGETGNVLSHMLIEGDGNQVRGNLVGLDPTGAVAAGPPRSWPEEGIRIVGDGNSVGGNPAVDPGVGNVISGHTVGVRVEGNDNDVFGNLIGLNAVGAETIGNVEAGIVVGDSAAGPTNSTDIFSNTVSGTIGDGASVIGAGIDVRTGAWTRIGSNRVGTDLSGTEALPNALGVSVGPAVERVSVTQNTVAGNRGTGILVDWGSPESITITFNRVGVGSDGEALPNGGRGIEVRARDGETFTGDVNPPFAPPLDLGFNLVGWNGSDGVLLHGVDAEARAIEIGGDRTFDPFSQRRAVSAMPNDGDGFVIEGGRVWVKDSAIGHNHGRGLVTRDVVFPDGTVNRGRLTVEDTEIFANDGLGLDVGDDGPNPYDPSDGVQDAPVITEAERTEGGLRVAGHVEALDASPSEVIVEVFVDRLEGCDPSGFGEGSLPVLAEEVAVGPSGVAAFDFTVEHVLDDVVTMTATPKPISKLWYHRQPTSEFSACAIVPEGTADLEATLTVESPVSAGETTLIRTRLSNHGPDPVATATMELRLPAGAEVVNVTNLTGDDVACTQSTAPGGWVLVTCVASVGFPSDRVENLVDVVLNKPGPNPVKFTVSTPGTDPDLSNNTQAAVIMVR